MDPKKTIDTTQAISWLVGFNLFFVAVKIFEAIDESSDSDSATLSIFIPIASVMIIGFVLFRRYMTKYSRCPFCYRFHKIGDACPPPKEKKSSD